MAFNDDSVKAKLSALNESSDSIVSVGQWIMFYRRYADRTAQLWLEKVKESNTSKKLNLIYLANEIMQQAKVRKKDDFIVAFMPIIAEGTALAYKGATPEVQNKIRRVVEVWRQRQVLETGIQDATEARIDGMFEPLYMGSLWTDMLSRSGQEQDCSKHRRQAGRYPVRSVFSATRIPASHNSAQRTVESRDGCEASCGTGRHSIRRAPQSEHAHTLSPCPSRQAGSADEKARRSASRRR